MTRTCEMCPADAPRHATHYCEADACYLCASCDEEVHGANFLAGRHFRRRLVPATASATDLSSLADIELDLEADSDMTLPTLDDACAALFEDMPVPVDYEFPDLQLALEPQQTTPFHRSPSASVLSWETVLGSQLEPLTPDAASSGMSSSSTTASAPSMMAPAAPVRRVKSDSALAARAAAASAMMPTLHPMVAALAVPPASPLSAVTADSSGGVSPARSPPPRAISPASHTHSHSHTHDSLTAEQRRELRMKALARFRSKRASRSFAKKVRYECRKQLADSRPRVKGRFVKKSEMALYVKYGAQYRNHLHEIAPESATHSS